MRYLNFKRDLINIETGEVVIHKNINYKIIYEDKESYLIEAEGETISVPNEKTKAYKVVETDEIYSF